MLQDHYSPLGAPQGGRRPARTRFGNQSVVFEVLPAELEGQGELVARLSKLVSLSHPGLVPLLDFGVADDASAEFGLRAGQRFLIHAGGAERADLQALSPEAHVAVIVQLLSIADYAHGQGLLLGDLAEDRLVATATAGELPRIGVRGLGPARGTSSVPTAAPERRAGESATIASDLYALGALVKRSVGEGAGTTTPLLLAVLGKLTQDDSQARYANAGQALQELLEWDPRAGSSLHGALREAPLTGRASELEDLLDVAEGSLLHARTPRGRLVGFEAQEAHNGGRHREVLAITGRRLRELSEDPEAPKGMVASLWNTRGLARFYLGDFDRARRLLRKSLKLCRELSHTTGVSVSLGNLACVFWSAGWIRSPGLPPAARRPSPQVRKSLQP